MTDHPITPPPELFKQWEDDILNERDNVDHVLDSAWRHGFHAGADQELEACCEHLKRIWAPSDTIGSLRAARRPKPPSLKEQALAALDALPTPTGQVTTDRFNIIRRALEQLDD